MELNVRNDSKIVEIWLTREEKQDAQMQRKLKLVYQSFHETGYTVATFLSGEQALDLALEQYAYCSDIVDQGVEPVGRLADGLAKSSYWYFWWD